MSGGFPEAKPCASCCPRAEATTTFTWIPVCFVTALAALLTANVSAGPELPIRAVSVVALPLWREPRAVPAVSASAATMTSKSAARGREVRLFRCAFTTEFLLGAIENSVGGARRLADRPGGGHSRPLVGSAFRLGRRDYRIFSRESQGTTLDVRRRRRQKVTPMEALPRPPARIADVAARAGVGIATVSRVVNDRGNV